MAQVSERHFGRTPDNRKEKLSRGGAETRRVKTEILLLVEVVFLRATASAREIAISRFDDRQMKVTAFKV